MSEGLIDFHRLRGVKSVQYLPDSAGEMQNDAHHGCKKQGAILARLRLAVIAIPVSGDSIFEQDLALFFRRVSRIGLIKHRRLLL